MTVFAMGIACDLPICTTTVVVTGDDATSLRRVRAVIRAEGWRHVTATPTGGPAQDLCPAHARPDREPDPPLFDVPTTTDSPSTPPSTSESTMETQA